MTKTELMENYTAEQLAEIHLSLLERFNKNAEALEKVVKKLPEELREKTELLLENEKLQSEVEKYRKVFEGAKKERDCQVAEYRKKIEELENRDITELLPTDPIKVADMLINAEGEYEHNTVAKAFCGTDKGTYRIFEISELRQIAEHLLIYCNHHGEAEE